MTTIGSALGAARLIIAVLAVLATSACAGNQSSPPARAEQPRATPTPVVVRWTPATVAEKDAKIRVGAVSSAFLTARSVTHSNDPALSAEPLSAGEEFLIVTLDYRYTGWGDQTITPVKEFYVEQGLRKIIPSDAPTLRVGNLLPTMVKDKQTASGNLAFRVKAGESADVLVYTFGKEILRIDIGDPAQAAAREYAELDATWAGGDWPKVIAVLERARSKSPGDDALTDKLYAACINQADKLLETGDRSNAVSLLDKAEKLLPARAEATGRLQALMPTPTPAPAHATATPRLPAATATSKPLPATATPIPAASPASPGEWIRGLDAEEVSRYLTKAGFACSGPQKMKTDRLWTCIKKEGTSEVRFETWGRTATEIWMVNGVVSDAMNPKSGDAAAQKWLPYIAGVQYDGAQPERAKAWAMQHWSDRGPIETTIGEARFEAFGTPGFRTIRPLSLTIPIRE
jgi:hypothetical protein